MGDKTKYIGPYVVISNLIHFYQNPNTPLLNCGTFKMKVIMSTQHWTVIGWSFLRGTPTCQKFLRSDSKK